MKNVLPLDGRARSTMPSSATPLPQKFHPGQIAATLSALRLLEKSGTNPLALVARHVAGDWGDCDRHGAVANEQALLTGARLWSVYRLVDDVWLKTMAPPERAQLPTLWIITDASDENGKRASTVILRPEDY